jgi:hypothetical protein
MFSRSGQAEGVQNAGHMQHIILLVCMHAKNRPEAKKLHRVRFTMNYHEMLAPKYLS